MSWLEELWMDKSKTKVEFYLPTHTSTHPLLYSIYAYRRPMLME